MAYIDALTEQEVTLRDFKSVLNRLMTNYNPKIPFETLEEPKEPGTYMAIDTFNIAENTPIPFVYGLYVDFDGIRDLRFFNDRASCQKWLNKKIKLLEK